MHHVTQFCHAHLISDLCAVFKDKYATFDDFALRVLNNIKTQAAAVKAHRIDIVADTYDPLSIKGQTREGRGSTPCESFYGTTALSGDMDEFMKNAENKTNLNALVAVHAMRPQTWGWDNEVVVTDNTTIRSSRVGVKDIFTWIPDLHMKSKRLIIGWSSISKI